MNDGCAVDDIVEGPDHGGDDEHGRTILSCGRSERAKAMLSATSPKAQLAIKLFAVSPKA